MRRWLLCETVKAAYRFDYVYVLFSATSRLNKNGPSQKPFRTEAAARFKLRGYVFEFEQRLVAYLYRYWGSDTSRDDVAAPPRGHALSRSLLVYSKM